MVDVNVIYLRRLTPGAAREWKWSSFPEYAGVDAAEQESRCGLTIDRVRLPPTRTRESEVVARTFAEGPRFVPSNKKKPRTYQTGNPGFVRHLSLLFWCP
jgi:hypothetical protein